MKKTGIFCFFAAVILSSVSCSLLWAPLDGRNNPADPSNNTPTITLTPLLDGYVANTTPTETIDFSATTLWINTSPTAVPLIRFDGGEFPRNVVAAELRLWINASSSVATEIRAHPILEDWSPGTVNWAQVSSDLVPFYDSSNFATAGIAAGVANVYVVLEVTQIFQRLIEAGNHGFYLECTAGAMSLHSSRGGNSPKLEIRGYN